MARGSKQGRREALIATQRARQANPGRRSSSQAVGWGLLVWLLWAAGASAQPSSNPWDVLNELRAGLVQAGPITARFEQTFVPAGFSGGDTDFGHVSLWLPECLRWNYAEPQVRSFLICKNQVWAWNEDEEGGRRYNIEAEKEPGLDLLLVDVVALRERYSAEGEAQAGGLFVIWLKAATVSEAAKKKGAKAGFSRAKITIDRTAQRVVGLEYSDEDGNTSRFVIREYQGLGHTALFQPPPDIQWTVE